MNNKQSLNQKDETILLAMGGYTFFFIIIILLLLCSFAKQESFWKAQLLSFDTLEYLSIHFYRCFSSHSSSSAVDENAKSIACA